MFQACIRAPLTLRVYFRDIEVKRARLSQRAKLMLGTQSERAEGKAAFETWPQAHGVKGERAYPMGCMVQQPPRIDAPAAAFKTSRDAELDEHQRVIKEFVSVS